MPGRRPARRPLADRGALLADLAEELAVSRRVSAVQSAGKDSDRCPRRGERATVGTSVDSVGPTVGYENPIAAQMLPPGRVEPPPAQRRRTGQRSHRRNTEPC